ncbi:MULTISPECIES: phage terminase small subunit P27 family [unclassified Kitasatospora]|uniref:phage terminase small subunit P27 family n=1 Tax=unclassified Kitasatospora TaxID=2633591 RepID=UPI0024763476|nr:MULTISPECIES: phage terminase small subunit P27 family [unclassified Kitasatospora]
MPNEKKRKLGNPGKRSLPELASVTPLPATGADTPPGLSEAGIELWGAVTATTKAWLAPSDRHTLTMLCEMADRRALMMAAVTEYGLLIERPGDGHLVANPVVAMLSTLEVQMNRVAASLGLTPADRTRMGLAEVKARSAFEQMLADRAGRVTN